MTIIALKTKIIALFKQGLTPHEIIKSIIVSGVVSIVPILGLSTLLLTGLSLRKKLNLPIMIAQSYMMWPVQILMVIPFINIGESIFSIPKTNHKATEIIASFQNSFFTTISRLSFELLCGFVGWFFTAVPIALGTYFVSIAVLKIILRILGRNDQKL